MYSAVYEMYSCIQLHNLVFLKVPKKKKKYDPSDKKKPDKNKIINARELA